MIKQRRLPELFCLFLVGFFFLPSKLSLLYFFNRYPVANKYFLPLAMGDLSSRVSKHTDLHRCQPVNVKVQHKDQRGGNLEVVLGGTHTTRKG